MAEFPIQTDRPGLDIVDPLSLIGVPLPTRRWIVNNWIPWGHTTAFYGDGGTGKSLLSQQLMTSAATGCLWLGLDVAPVRALGFFCEDEADELHRRQDAINRAYGIGFGDLEDMAWVSRVGDDNVLMAFEHDGRGKLTELYFDVLHAAKDQGAQLVIIDTAADTFGGNENIRGQARQFVSSALGHLAQEIDGAVVLCAHPSLAGLRSGDGSGGSTAWSNAVRSRLYLSYPEEDGEAEVDPDLRILSTRKSNYARKGDEIRLRWQDGAFVAVGHTGRDGILGTTDRRRKEDETEATFLACLSSFAEQGRPVSDARSSTNFAPKMFRASKFSNGMSKRELERAMNRLLDDGKIKIETIGPPSRMRRQIVLAARD